MAAQRPELRGRSSECAQLDRLLADAREGRSAVLVIRGEAGVGKTALLRYAAEQASGFRVAQIAGVESEMELAYAGLHQLCAPMLGQLDVLPEPQRARPQGRVGSCVRRSARPLPRRVGDARPAVRGGRGAAAAVHRGRSPMARRCLCTGARVRRAPAAGRARGARVRRTRARRRAPARRACPSCRCGGSTTTTPVRCSRRSSRAGSTSAFATGSSPRRAAIRSPCWSCRAA